MDFRYLKQLLKYDIKILSTNYAYVFLKSYSINIEFYVLIKFKLPCFFFLNKIYIA